MRTKKVWVWLAGACLLVGVAAIIGFTNVYRGPRGHIVYNKRLCAGNEGIYTMDPDGNNVERITFSDRSNLPMTSPVWSPDGDTVAFGCKVGEENNLCVVGREAWKNTRPTGPYFTSLINWTSVPADFCSREPAYHLKSVSWVPDGRRLAFTCARAKLGGTLVCIINLEGDVEDCWPISAVNSEWEGASDGEAQVAWSPDGGRLALSFESQMYRWEIHLADPDGQNGVFLHEGEKPRWSLDGKRLVFIYDHGIAAIDRDGSNFQSLYTPVHLGIEDIKVFSDLIENPAIVGCSSVVWSPDGRYVAFTAYRRYSFDPPCDAIHLLNLRTREIEMLTALDDGLFRDLDWAP